MHIFSLVLFSLHTFGAHASPPECLDWGGEYKKVITINRDLTLIQCGASANTEFVVDSIYKGKNTRIFSVSANSNYITEHLPRGMVLTDVEGRYKNEIACTDTTCKEIACTVTVKKLTEEQVLKKYEALAGKGYSKEWREILKDLVDLAIQGSVRAEKYLDGFSQTFELDGADGEDVTSAKFDMKNSKKCKVVFGERPLPSFRGEFTALASSNIGASASNNYSAAMVVDSNQETAWCFNNARQGIGEWLELKAKPNAIGKSCKAIALQIISGYRKSRDAFESNGRVSKVTFSSCGSAGTGAPFVLEPKENEVIAKLDLTAKSFRSLGIAWTDCFRMTVASTRPGKKSKDVCISDLDLRVDADCP